MFTDPLLVNDVVCMQYRLRQIRQIPLQKSHHLPNIKHRCPTVFCIHNHKIYTVYTVYMPSVQLMLLETGFLLVLESFGKLWN